jgi:hypothetical protein
MPRVFVAVLAALSLIALTAGARADGNDLRNEFYRGLHQPQRAHLGWQTTATPPERASATLLITGMIGPGAYDRFRAELMRRRPTLVVIDGPGGVLGEALRIGEEVRRRRLDTLVAADRYCASACAVVFLSGRARYLGAGATVGLHAASYNGRADPEATALMADYLRRVGVPGATLALMARTAPSEIRWLTRAEQQAIGIRAYR